MNGLEATIGINGFSNGFWSINHWSRWSFSLATIGLDGFAMDFGLATIGLDGFSMVANLWSNDGMVTIHRYGLLRNLAKGSLSPPKWMKFWKSLKFFGEKTYCIFWHCFMVENFPKFHTCRWGQIICCAHL